MVQKANQVLENIKEFIPLVPLLISLKRDGIQKRHQEQILQLVNIKGENYNEFNF
jgi:hypothetical protein